MRAKKKQTERETEAQTFRLSNGATACRALALLPPNKPAMTDADATMNDLFGSESDEDGTPPPPAAVADASPSPPDPAPSAPSTAPLGPPVDLEAPLVPPLPRPADLRLVRLGRLPALEPTPYDPSTFAPPPPSDPSPAAAAEAAVRAVATVRHWVAADGALQSNARVVEWDDGSTHVFVGADAYSVTPALLGTAADGPAAPRAYVAARHAAVVQVVAPLSTRWALAPADLKASAHRRLAATLDARHARSARVVTATLMQDPVAAKKRREEEEEARIRERAGLAKRQRAARRGGSAGAGPRVRRIDRLSAAYLEADDAVDSGEEEEEEGEGGDASTRARGALARRTADTRDAAARLAAAKAGGDDDDGDGFVVDEDEEVEVKGGGDDEPEASTGGGDDDDDDNKASPAREVAPPPKKAAPRLVLSDSD